MAFEGDLGEISLASETIKKEEIDHDVVKVDKFDDDAKKELEEKLLESDVGEKLDKFLAEIAEKENAEDKKTALVDFLKKSFNKDKLLTSLVADDGKKYGRLAMGDDNFDVETDQLDPLVKRVVDLATDKVNKWVEKEEEKVTLTYELVIQQTKEELAALKDQISTPSGTKESFRDMFSFEKIKQYGADWGKVVQGQIKSVIDGVKWFVTSIPETIGSITGAFGSLKGMFKKKDA
jgi:hypothetical protein